MPLKKGTKSKNSSKSSNKKAIKPQSKKIQKTKPIPSKTAKKSKILDPYPHVASKVLMVEPTGFFLNEETFKDNKFMQRVNDSRKKTTDKAI